MRFSSLSHLSCTRCAATYEADRLIGVCTAPGCGGPLFAEYDLPVLSKGDVAGRPQTIWRWHEVMPARRPEDVVSLGEGGTPLLRAERLGGRLGMPRLFVKEEAGNPTGSFKARGLAAAVTMAKALGAKALALPTAGNAGGAAAAYAAKAGLPC